MYTGKKETVSFRHNFFLRYFKQACIILLFHILQINIPQINFVQLRSFYDNFYEKFFHNISRGFWYIQII